MQSKVLILGDKGGSQLGWDKANTSRLRATQFCHVYIFLSQLTASGSPRMERSQPLEHTINKCLVIDGKLSTLTWGGLSSSCSFTVIFSLTLGKPGRKGGRGECYKGQTLRMRLEVVWPLLQEKNSIVLYKLMLMNDMRH